MPITANNRTFNTIAEDGTEELAFIEIDYGNDVSSETGDFDDATVTTGGLGMIQRGLEQFVNVLGKGPLTDSNTRQTFIVRADGLSRDSDENGGLEYAKKVMINYQKEALEILSEFPKNQYRVALQKLVMYVISRKR